MEELERILSFVYAMPVGALLIRRDGAIELANPVATALLLPLARDGNLVDLLALLEPRTPGLRELVTGYAAESGTIVEQRKVTVKNAAGEVRVLAVTILALDADTCAVALNDVTVVVERERKLFVQEQRLRAIVDTMREYAIFTADNEGRVDEWNRSLERFTDLGQEAAIGQPLGALFDVNVQAASGGTLEEARRTGRAKFEAEVCSASNEKRWAEVHVSHLVDAEGETNGFGVVLHDTTVQRAHEKLLVALAGRAEAESRAKSAFLANMSHEIRTPLTAILGFADVLRDDAVSPVGDGQRSLAISSIQNAGAHLLAVINDILDLSKIEADKMTVESVETPVDLILSEIESIMRPRAQGKGLTFSTVFETPVPRRIACDPTRLRQILMNLVGNAVKFTETGSVTTAVSVGHVAGAEQLVIDVTDTGPGMTPVQASRLFEPFGQADRTVTRKHGGTGLGLTICRRLAGLLGGTVSIRGTEPGEGSCFRLVLPLVSMPGSPTITSLASVEERAVAKPAALAKLAGRILLAEDGIDNQQLISFHLKKAGARVDIAEDGVVALRKIDEAIAQGAPYDLLVSDMQMPEMDGYTLARTLRSRGSTLAIVALTAHAMSEEREKCLTAGCDDYSTKPIDKPLLLAMCARWLGRSGGSRTVAC